MEPLTSITNKQKNDFMKKTIAIMVLLILTSCQKYNDKDGISEINYIHRDKEKTLTAPQRHARDYCQQKGMDFVVIKQEYPQEHVNENVAGTVEHMPTKANKMTENISDEANEKLRFRCVRRE